MSVKQHFVHFLSPGTLSAEETVRPIKRWDIAAAVEMSLDITERYDAVPYGFHFSTRERGPKDLDSKETKRSGTYYLSGRIETIREVEARNNPEEAILLDNMRANGWKKIVVNDNSWRWVQPFRKGDKVLNVQQEVSA